MIKCSTSEKHQNVNRFEVVLEKPFLVEVEVTFVSELGKLHVT
jgi:hypothetical protein